MREKNQGTWEKIEGVRERLCKVLEDQKKIPEDTESRESNQFTDKQIELLQAILDSFKEIEGSDPEKNLENLKKNLERLDEVDEEDISQVTEDLEEICEELTETLCQDIYKRELISNSEQLVTHYSKRRRDLELELSVEQLQRYKGFQALNGAYIEVKRMMGDAALAEATKAREEIEKIKEADLKTINALIDELRGLRSLLHELLNEDTRLHEKLSKDDHLRELSLSNKGSSNFCEAIKQLDEVISEAFKAYFKRELEAAYEASCKGESEKGQDDEDEKIKRITVRYMELMREIVKGNRYPITLEWLNKVYEEIRAEKGKRRDQEAVPKGVTIIKNAATYPIYWRRSRSSQGSANSEPSSPFKNNSLRSRFNAK